MIYLNQVVESSLIDGWASKWEEDPSENDIEDKQAPEELDEELDEGNYDFDSNNSGPVADLHPKLWACHFWYIQISFRQFLVENLIVIHLRGLSYGSEVDFRLNSKWIRMSF